MSKTKLLTSSATATAREPETVPEADPITAAERGFLRTLDPGLLRRIARRHRAARRRKNGPKEKLLDTSAAAERERETVPQSDLMTPAEFARYRRCSPRTLDRERATGRGCPYVRLGVRILYRRADAERYIEQNVRGLYLKGPFASPSAQGLPGEPATQQDKNSGRKSPQTPSSLPTGWPAPAPASLKSGDDAATAVPKCRPARRRSVPRNSGSQDRTAAAGSPVAGTSASTAAPFGDVSLSRRPLLLRARSGSRVTEPIRNSGTNAGIGRR